MAKLEGVRLAQLLKLVEDGKTKKPELESRLEAAVTILLFRDVRKEGEVYFVESETSSKAYEASPAKKGTCSCTDYRRGNSPSGWCKHRLAAAYLERLDEVVTDAKAEERDYKHELDLALQLADQTTALYGQVQAELELVQKEAALLKSENIRFKLVVDSVAGLVKVLEAAQLLES